jgi:phosphatidylglycerophosphatase A
VVCVAAGPAARTPAGQEARALCERELLERGVRLQDVAELVLQLQRPFVPGLGVAECAESVEAVLAKREVCNALLTGIALDRLAEAGSLPEPLQSTVRHDDPLYGIDEVLALSIVNIYGSIGFTNFGYLDKVKPGVVGRMDRRGHESARCNTFLDDLIAAVAAAAAARIAHNHRDTLGP